MHIISFQDVGGIPLLTEEWDSIRKTGREEKETSLLRKEGMRRVLPRQAELRGVMKNECDNETMHPSNRGDHVERVSVAPVRFRAVYGESNRQRVILTRHTRWPDSDDVTS